MLTTFHIDGVRLVLEDISLRVSLIVIEVEVHDGYGWPVPDLRHDNFVVFEDGKEQPIAVFRQKNTPDTAASQGEYEIGYYPPSNDGEFKKVRVRFQDAKDARDRGLRLGYSPRGYYATSTNEGFVSP